MNDIQQQVFCRYSLSDYASNAFLLLLFFGTPDCICFCRFNVKQSSLHARINIYICKAKVKSVNYIHMYNYIHILYI